VGTLIGKLKQLNEENAEYWNEPCGFKLATRTNTIGKWKEFDVEYFKLYPFLYKYLDKLSGDVLEIGTGYGTVGTYLANRCNTYVGCDIAEGPIRILKARGLNAFWSNIFLLPYRDESFDGVVSIGCIHHTGSVRDSIKVIRRLLVPGGRALIMIYNKHATVRPVDHNSEGVKAPYIEYTDVKQLPGLFRYWSEYKYTLENGNNKDIYIEAVK